VRRTASVRLMCQVRPMLRLWEGERLLGLEQTNRGVGADWLVTPNPKITSHSETKPDALLTGQRLERALRATLTVANRCGVPESGGACRNGVGQDMLLLSPALSCSPSPLSCCPARATCGLPACRVPAASTLRSCKGRQPAEACERLLKPILPGCKQPIDSGPFGCPESF